MTLPTLAEARSRQHRIAVLNAAGGVEPIVVDTVAKLGAFGVHKWIGGYVITYLPTGLRLHSTTKLSDAKRFLRALRDIPAEGTFGMAPSDKCLGAILQIFYAELSRR